jgi:hypothetical protein
MALTPLYASIACHDLPEIATLNHITPTCAAVNEPPVGSVTIAASAG